MKTASVVLVGHAMIASCAGAEDEALPFAPNFLRLQSWVQADAVNLTLQGYLRWSYVADDPSVTAEPRENCETWEYLDLQAAAEIDAACLGCEALWSGSAAIDDAQNTCSTSTWEPRSFTLAFAPLVGSSVESEELVDAGFTHAVATRWSPDLGETQGYQWLFAAEPQAWTDEGGTPGTPSGQAPAGEYHLFGHWYWDVR